MADKVAVKDLVVGSTVKFYNDRLQVIKIENTGDPRYKAITVAYPANLSITHIFDVNNTFPVGE